MAARSKKTAQEPFPFPEDHYLSTPSTAPRSHSSGAHVRMVNEALGVEGDIFNANTRTALLDRQGELGLPVTGVVDPATWDALMSGERGDGSGGDHV